MKIIRILVPFLLIIGLFYYNNNQGYWQSVPIFYGLLSLLVVFSLLKDLYSNRKNQLKK